MWGQYFVGALVFFLASVTVAENLVPTLAQYPRDCWQHSTGLCLLSHPYAQVQSLQAQAGVEIKVGEQTALLRKHKAADATIQWHLVAGELWLGVSAGESFELFTEFGRLVCRACEMYVQRSEKQVEVVAVSGDVRLVPKAAGLEYLLPPQMQTQMRGVRIQKGQAQVDIAQPVMFRGWAKTVARFHQGDRDSLRSRLQWMHRQWVAKVHETAAEFQQASQKRLVAAVEKKQAEKQQREQKQQDQKVFRELLRRRAFEGL